MLAVLTDRQLAHAMFPIGDTAKPDVRAEAAERGLRVADKPDSHDICFIPSGDTRAFLAERIGVRPGAVVDAGTGRELARHGGVHGFTVGQRKGLGVAAPAADGRPRYVLGIEPASGTVRVGPAERAGRALDHGRAARCGAPAARPGTASAASCRSGRTAGWRPAVVEPGPDGLRVRLDEPLRGVAPGQTVALYDPDPGGDIVLGSATIVGTGGS